MSVAIKGVRLRVILNSCGKLGYEAQVLLSDGSIGKGAVPAALAPGRREKPRSSATKLGPVRLEGALGKLVNRLKDSAFESQLDLDAMLEVGDSDLHVGSDVTLSVSLAFCRASAASSRTSLVGHMAELGGFQPVMPHPLVGVFSGGIHGDPRLVPFQQIMILPRLATLEQDITAAVRLYNQVEALVKAKSLLSGYSASSGMLCPSLDYRNLMDIIREQIARLDCGERVAIAVDVAAEHLKGADGLYAIDGRRVVGESLVDFYCDLIDKYQVTLIEDPFDPADTHLWRRLMASVGDRTTIIGDDLFATNATNVTEGLANGILLKMNQVGTVSATIRAAQAASALNMRLYVSHRSCETEDVAMCDLAVAVAADAVKIGGPRRGDRICKYNRLLELSEEYNARCELWDRPVQ